jgi:hypothetical protein
LKRVLKARLFVELFRGCLPLRLKVIRFGRVGAVTITKSLNVLVSLQCNLGADGEFTP